MTAEYAICHTMIYICVCVCVCIIGVPHASVLALILTRVGTTVDVEGRYYNEPAGKCAVELFGLRFKI